MLNPVFWKNDQGQKHPGRWGIVELQIPSIKCQKSQAAWYSTIIIREQDTIGKPKKTELI